MTAANRCTMRASERMPRAAASSSRPRGAMTLVEVIVSVALLSILLSVVTSLLVALQQRDRRLNRFSVGSERLARLAETVRTDIRRATAVATPGGEVLLVSLPGEREARYELVPQGCRRTASAPGEARAGVELFAIGPAARWTVETRDAGRRPLVVVQLDRAAPDADDSTSPQPSSRRSGSFITRLLVHAALGADAPAQPAIQAAD